MPLPATTLPIDNLMEPPMVNTYVNEPDQNSIPSPHHQPRRPTVEEVPDEDAPLPPLSTPASHAVFVEPFPEEGKARAVWGTGTLHFESICHAQESAGDAKWGPFEDEEEWQLAKWLISNVSKKQTDAYLRLPIVSQTAQLLRHLTH